MNCYIAPTTSMPLKVEIHFLKFVFRYQIENHAFSGFGVYDEMDLLIANFSSYQQAINYCQENELNLV